MKSLGSFVRIPALVAAAGALLSRNIAQAALSSNGGTSQNSSAAVWICLAVFILGTLGVAFWKSKWREAE